METASYSHWAVSFLTWETICLAVIFGPETNFCGVFSPEASIFTCVPPTSIANTLMHWHHIVFHSVQKQSVLRGDPETLPSCCISGRRASAMQPQVSALGQSLPSGQQLHDSVLV